MRAARFSCTEILQLGAHDLADVLNKDVPADLKKPVVCGVRASDEPHVADTKRPCVSADILKEAAQKEGTVMCLRTRRRTGCWCQAGCCQMCCLRTKVCQQCAGSA
jgi:hypothetical protein